MSGPHKSVLIAPADTGLRVEVGDDGVFIGFFAESGKMTLMNVAKLERVSPALAAWCADRRRQAASETA